MATDLLTTNENQIGEINKYDFRTVSKPVFRAVKGLNEDIVSQISEMKNEPEWMRDFRLRSLKIFESKPMPHWGGDIAVNFQDIERTACVDIEAGWACVAWLRVLCRLRAIQCFSKNAGKGCFPRSSAAAKKIGMGQLS